MPMFRENSDEAKAYTAVSIRNPWVGGRPRRDLKCEDYALSAAYEAAKMYERHCAVQGIPPTETKARALLDALIDVYVDRQSKDHEIPNFLKYEARRHGKRHIEQALRLAGQYNDAGYRSEESFE